MDPEFVEGGESGLGERRRGWTACWHLLRDWAGTVAFLITFSVILLVFEVTFRIAWLFGRRPLAYTMGALQAAIIGALRLCGARVEVERSPLVKASTTYVIVSNHQSMFDIPIFGWQLFTNFPKYVSKVELARRIPAISFQLRRGGHALIDRGDSSQAVEAIARLGREIVEHGTSAVIFPEGTRARRGTLASFRRAGTMALLDAARKTPVVPVCIDNSWRILEHGMFPIPYGLRIHCWIGDPIERCADEDPERLLAEVESQIRACMKRLRSQSASSTG